MKKIVSCFLCLFITLLLLSPTPSYASSNTKDGVGELKTLITVGVGPADDQLTYTPKGIEVANDGPASFAVYKNETYILDTLAKRILVYKNNKYERILQTPFTIYPRDIVVDKDKIYILDTDIRNIFVIDKDGVLCKEYPLPANVPSFKITNFVSDYQQNIMIEADSHYYDITNGVETKGLKNKDQNNLKIVRDKKTARLISDDKEIYSVNFGDLQGASSIASIDSNDNVIVSITDISSNPMLLLTELTYRKIDKTGKELGVIRIPLETYSSFPLNHIKIDENGDAYVMALKEDRVEISKIVFGKTYNSKLANMKTQKSYKSTQNNMVVENGLITPATLSISRSTVAWEASLQTDHQWTFAAMNADEPPGTCIPDWLSSLNYGSKMGIPYCWGGFDGTSTRSCTSWNNYDDAMTKSALAGNVSCTGGWKAGTAGLDCSGFVSAAYKFTSHCNTSWFASYGRQISYSALQDCDFIVAAGDHIVLYKGTSTDGSYFFTQESTVSGNDMCKWYTRTVNYLSTNGYVARTPW